MLKKDEADMMRKKGQMEIMGLVLIVVLISLGFLFYLRFSVLSPDKGDVRKSTTESALASNIINTMLSTTSKDCQNREIKELIQDCAGSVQIVCDDYSGSPPNSCQYIEGFFSEILDKTLGEWQRDYQFTVEGIPDDNLGYGAMVDLNMQRGDCSGERESKFFALPSNSGENIIITLSICN